MPIPLKPCLIDNALVGDPNLQQVVTYTYEGGLRGHYSVGKGQMDWTVGGFHALNTDDIISVASPIIGHVFFQNAGNTLRRGIEANLTYTWDRWNIYGNFTYVDATFRNALTLSSPFNPFANANGDIFVVPGDHITRRPIRHPPTGVGSIFLPKFLRSAAQVKSNAPTRYRFPAPAKQRHRP